MSLVPSPFKFTGRAIRFTDGSVSRGLTKVIKKHFVPSFKYKNMVGRDILLNKSTLSYAKARTRGKQVDAALTQYCTTGKQASDLPEVHAIVRTLTNRNLELIATQYAVAWPQARLGTQLDLVAKHKETGRIVVIEIKTGCHYRRCSTKQGTIIHLGCPEKRVTDAPLHQHQLQVQLGRFLLGKTLNRPEKDFDLLLIYADMNGAVEAFSQKDIIIPLQTSEETQNVLLFTGPIRTTRKRHTSYKMTSKRKRHKLT